MLDISGKVIGVRQVWVLFSWHTSICIASVFLNIPEFQAWDIYIYIYIFVKLSAKSTEKHMSQKFPFATLLSLYHVLYHTMYTQTGLFFTWRFASIVACNNSLFFFISEYFIVWIYHKLWIYSSLDSHVHYFLVFVITNNSVFEHSLESLCIDEWFPFSWVNV
jgi:hypothetical protein